MKTQTSRNAVAARRAQLIAELFLEELEPLFLSKPTSDVGYDLLVGFTNDKAGVNTFAVQVKSTIRQPGPRFTMPRRTYQRLAHSNVPVLLLVVDVKQNQLHFAWLRPLANESHTPSVSIALMEVTETTKRILETAFKKAEPHVAAVG